MAEKLLRDGQISFLRGMDSGRQPSLIDPSAVAFGVNTTFRNGYCAQRNGFKQIGLAFSESNHAQWFLTKRVQGWGVYYPLENDPVVVVSVSGRIFGLYPLDGWSIEELTPPINIQTALAFTAPAVGATVTIQVTNTIGLLAGQPLYINDKEYAITQVVDGSWLVVSNVNDTPGAVVAALSPTIGLQSNPEYPEQVWMEQADNYFVIQDGVSRPIIYDFPNVYRSSIQKKEVPVGTAMAYGMGRLWVAVNDRQLVAGDIVNGDSTVIRFTENDFINEGFAFSVPVSSGKITALRFIANLDTSLGQGPLFVFTTNSIFSLNAPTDRDTWKSLTNPIQTYSMLNYGAEGNYGVVGVNSDLWYRSKIGIQSFILARRDYTSWGNSPASSELNAIQDNEAEKLLRFASGILFDNRLLMTANPQPRLEGAYFKGISVLDFNPVSSIAGKEAPAYDGLWTGIQPAGLLKATIDSEERAFAFVVNSEGQNEFWEITKRDEFDNEDGRIVGHIETRQFDFKYPFQPKRLRWLEFYADKIKGDVTFTIHWKPDGYPCWFPWHTFSVCQQYRTCTTDPTICNVLDEKQPGFRTRLRIPDPPNYDEASNNKTARTFYHVQFRIQWEGRARLLRMVAAAEPIEDVDGRPTC